MKITQNTAETLELQESALTSYALGAFMVILAIFIIPVSVLYTVFCFIIAVVLFVLGGKRVIVVSKQNKTLQYASKSLIHKRSFQYSAAEIASISLDSKSQFRGSVGDGGRTYIVSMLSVKLKDGKSEAIASDTKRAGFFKSIRSTALPIRQLGTEVANALSVPLEDNLNNQPVAPTQTQN